MTKGSYEQGWCCGPVFFCSVPGPLPIRLAVSRLHTPPCERSALRRLQGTAVRQLLRKCLRKEFPSVAEEDWIISAPGAGSPSVIGPKPLDISLSHRGSWVACALSEGGPVGIDIESVLQPLDPRVWEVFLHADEISNLEALPEHSRSREALGYWCCKEAWLKASGYAGQIAMTELRFSPQGQLVEAPPDLVAEPLAWCTRIGMVGGEALVALAHIE